VLHRDGEHEYRVVGLPNVLDLLSREACARYVQAAYTEPMAAEYACDLGRTVETVWVDEPHFIPPAMPWSRTFADDFNGRWGYDIRDELPSLFAEVGDYRKVRHHYWRTILDLLLGAYFHEVASWCEEHGVLFSGHLMGEDTLQAQIGFTAATMPCYEAMGLPGIDHLTRSLEWPADRRFIMTPKQCSSAAGQLGKERVLAEMYGVSSQGLSFADRKRIAEWMMMLGINERCIHGSFYSLRGRRKRIYAPHLSHQQPWWRENRFIADHFARFSWLMRRGDYVADVLVLHPVESGFCVYDATQVTNRHDHVHEHPAGRKLTESLITLAESLLAAHRGFDFGDETLIARHGSIEEGAFRVGQRRYRAVVVPDAITVRSTTFELLHAFAASGGTILVAGATPDRLEGEANEQVARFFETVRHVANEPAAIGRALDEALGRRVTLTTAGGGPAEHILLHERRVDQSALFFLTNPTHEKTTTVELTVHESGRFSRWSCETGEVTQAAQEPAAGGTRATLTLPPAGSAVLEFIAGAEPVTVAPEATTRAVQLDPRYRVKRLTPNVLTLDVCRYRTGESAWSDPMPVAAVQETLADADFSGEVELAFTFAVDSRPQRISLVVEDAHEWSIAVNGTPVAYEGAAPFVDAAFEPVDIAAVVRTGENTVEMKRGFEPPQQPRFRLGSLFQTATGVELEAVYLIGDFAVSGTKTGVLAGGGTGAATTRPSVRFAPRFSLAAEPTASAGDLLVDGFPFFAGRLALEVDADLPAPENGERVVLVLPGLDAAVARVSVNGSDADPVAWAPYEADITSGVSGGSTTITVELLTSLRNMLGPHHRPSGEPDQVWQDGWTGRAETHRRDTQLVAGPDWWKHRNDGSVFWTDDYCFIPFGLPEGLRVEYRR
ncbi:MAG: glycosyl hydrolase, partial [Spirochaetota bacterium]